MKQFLRDNAADIAVGGGVLLLVIGMGMMYVPLAPITAGVACIAVGVLMAMKPKKAA